MTEIVLIDWNLREELLNTGDSTGEINCGIGAVDAKGAGDGTAVVATLIGPGGVTFSPRQDALEWREEVEDRQGHEATVVGHHEPSSQGSSVADSLFFVFFS